MEDLQTAGLLATSCMNLDGAMVGGLAAAADTELASRRDELVRYGVRIRHLRSAEVPRLMSLQAERPALSAYDAEALVVARSKNAVLLTGDGSIRRAAFAEGVAVRGVIGELNRLAAALIIDPPTALISLENIVASGSRLLRDEVDAARRQWSRRIHWSGGSD